MPNEQDSRRVCFAHRADAALDNVARYEAFSREMPSVGKAVHVCHDIKREAATGEYVETYDKGQRMQHPSRDAVLRAREEAESTLQHQKCS